MSDLTDIKNTYPNISNVYYNFLSEHKKDVLLKSQKDNSKIVLYGSENMLKNQTFEDEKYIIIGKKNDNTLLINYEKEKVFVESELFIKKPNGDIETYFYNEVNEMSQYFKSKKRWFEEKVIDFFEKNIPEIQNYTQDCFGDCICEDVGLYYLVPKLVLYMTKCVHEKNEEKTRLFLKIFTKFYLQFGQEYQELYNDTIDSLISCELFEAIELGDYTKEEKDFVISNFTPELKVLYDKANW